MVVAELNVVMLVDQEIHPQLVHRKEMMAVTVVLLLDNVQLVEEVLLLPVQHLVVVLSLQEEQVQQLQLMHLQ